MKNKNHPLAVLPHVCHKHFPFSVNTAYIDITALHSLSHILMFAMSLNIPFLLSLSLHPLNVTSSCQLCSQFLLRTIFLSLTITCLLTTMQSLLYMSSHVSHVHEHQFLSLIFVLRYTILLFATIVVTMTSTFLMSLQLHYLYSS